MTLEPETQPEAAARPTLEGTVLAVCLGPGGLPKDPVDEADLRDARLTLSHAVAQILRNGLDLLGVSAPEQM